MKALQNLLINNEQQFIQDCTDDDIRQRLQDMLEDDQKTWAFSILWLFSTVLRVSQGNNPEDDWEDNERFWANFIWESISAWIAQA